MNYQAFFPANSAFANYDLRRLQAEVADLRQAASTLAADLHHLAEQVRSMNAA
jgi:hypothetical protein